MVAAWVPWPATSGGRMRLATVVTALAELGDVDFFGLLRPGSPHTIEDPPVRLSRVELVTRPSAREGTRGAAGWLAGRLPRRLSRLDHSATRAAFDVWATGHYDVVWHYRVDTFVAVGGRVDAPTVVDFDDLAEERLRKQAVLAAGRAGRLRSRLDRGVAALDERRWQRLQDEVASRVDAAVVSGERDRGALRAARAVVVPNGYERPAPAVGRADVGSPPTLGFQGDLRRAPNADAARFLATEVLTLVRRTLPDAQLRLIGPAGDDVLALDALPGVTVTGWVDELAHELSRVDVVAAALRFGAGSPLKVAEAFAHRIPVVATPNALENLDARPDTHVLTGESAAELASSCVALLTDVPLRTRLADAAEELYAREYAADVVGTRVKALVRELVDQPGPSRGSRGTEPVGR